MNQYCGCCGSKRVGELEDWCAACKEHVAKGGSLWDRTYFAQHDKPCPFTQGSFEVPLEPMKPSPN